MKKHVIVVLFLLSSSLGFAQRFDWVSFTPLLTGNSSQGGIAVTGDAEGNIYSVSVFNEPTIVGEDTLYHGGNLNRPDILLIKWSASGQPLAWRQFYNFSTNGNPDPQVLDFDPIQNQVLLTISSYYSGTPITLVGNETQEDQELAILHGGVLRFDTNLNYISKADIPGGATYYCPSQYHEGFVYSALGYVSTVSKIDDENNVDWSVTPSSGMSYYTIADIAVSDEAVYVLGYYMDGFNSNQTITFGNVSLTPPAELSSETLLLFKLNLDGEPIDGTVIPINTAYTQPVRLCADNDGNLYIASGYNTSGQSFGAFTLGAMQGGTDGYLVKLDNAFTPQWLTEFHHTGGNLEMRDVIVQENGDVMVIGMYGQNMTIGDFVLDPAQYGTGFLAQMNEATGDINYATNYGGLSSGTGRPMNVYNADDKYYITGLSYGTTGPGLANTASYGCYTETRMSFFLTCFNDIPFEAPSVSLNYSAPLLTASSNSPEATFEWMLNGDVIENAITNSLEITELGEYTVTVTSFGCTASASINVTSITSTQEFDENVGLQFYPNPAKNTVQLVLNSSTGWVVITDLQGKTILRESIHSSTPTLSIASLANGTYVIRVMNDTTCTSGLLIKE